MANWLNTIEINQLPPGEHHVMVIESTPIALFNVDGEIYVIEDCCTHQGLPLSDGYLDNTEITCPFHGAKFCIKSGQALSPPAFEKLKTFASRIEDGVIQIEFS